jgi:hypothetical protein
MSSDESSDENSQGNDFDVNGDDEFRFRDEMGGMAYLFEDIEDVEAMDMMRHEVDTLFMCCQWYIVPINYFHML